MKKIKLTGITFGLSTMLVLAGCSSNQSEEQATGESAGLGEQLDYTITGIEPGAGLTGLTKNALEEYENLEGWELLESSTAGMLGSLEEAIKKEEPIIVTGWTPHWKFSAYDLKILEDPKGALGNVENIHTLAREGLEEDMPSAYKILDRFHWEIEDIESITLDAQESSIEEAARNWVEENPDRVAEWTDGVEKVDGQEIELVTTQWDSEMASSNVIKVVLEKHGFAVTITPVDPAIMFQAIAAGEGDATVAPWLPTTHGSFYEEYKDDMVDLGENATGTKNGLVVPAYMDIDSIEDLEPKE